MEIRFAEYDRSETLVDFPALVVLDEKPNGFSYDGFLSPVGYDLRFSNGTETVALDYEIESWNPKGTSYVWVRVPEFSSNCVIRAYWGSPAAVEQPASCTNGAVWAAPYRGVWHLTPELADSTAYANGGYHPANATDDREGPVGRARQTGTGKYVAMTRSSEQLAVTNTFTYSFWAKTSYPAVSGNNMYVYQLKPAGGDQVGIICGYVLNGIEFYAGNGYVGDNPRTGSKIPIPDSDWHHYAYTYDGNVWTGCRDGVPVFGINSVFRLTPRTGTNLVQLGASRLPTGGSGDYFAGALDEFRVESVGRSTNWIYACYLNQRRAMTKSVPIRFPEYDRSETLTNFPALVVLNERLPGFSYDTFRSSSGYDLRFSDDTDTVGLNYEIESWNPSGNSYVWVQVPEFTSNCTLRASWGNPAVTNLYASCTNGAVWAEPYRGVWHLAPDLKDATAYTNNGAGAATTDLRGPVGAHARKTALNASIALQGTSEQLAVSNVFTFSFWAKTASPATNKTYIYQLAPKSGGQQTGILCGYTADKMDVFVSGGSGSVPNMGGVSLMTIPDGNWHHYAYTYDGAIWGGCRDGQSMFRSARVFSLNPKAGTNNVRIGSSQNADYFRGGLDEFRVEAAGRSTNWFYACYRNQQVRREGCDYLRYPVFGARGTVSDIGAVSAKVGAYFSCQFPVAGRLFYGASDSGEAFDGWDASLSLGSLSTGTVSTNLTGLLPDRNYVYRCFASNEMGVAWSAPFTFRTAPDFSQYAYKMKFTFSGYAADETLTNFPVAVVLSERLNGFSYRTFASETGRDLRFADENGRLLNHEMETWNTGGDSTVWVQVPEFRRGGCVWAFWGNRASVDLPAYCANGDVWDASFCGVYHLTPELKDATFSANHVVSNALTEATGGKVSFARSFTNGASLLLGPSGSLGVSDAFTFSAWMKSAYPCTTGMYFYGRMPLGQNAQQHALICGYATNQVEFYASGYFGADPRAGSSLSIPDDGWHQYAYTYNGSVWAGYCDGEPVFSTNRLFSLAFTDDFTINLARIGCSSVLANPFTGGLDELRIEKAGRTANWIRASYANQNAPEAFCTSGGAVSLRGTVIVVH
jgi:hypothetical protein